MSEPAEPGDGDVVRVATCESATEAHLLRGVLESAGLAPRVADAHTVQANAWMTQAVGGVRVLVPAAQARDALQVIAQFHAGAFQLEGEQAAGPTYQVQASPVFSPDRAALLSLVLTPVFGAAVQWANAATLRDGARRRAQWAWLLVLTLASVAATAVMHRLNPGPGVIFRASLAMSAVTLVWYFVSGQDQSRALLATYGPRFQRRSLVVPAGLVALLLLAAGWLLSELA